MTVPSNLIPTRVTQLPEYQGTSTLGYCTYSIDGHLYKAQLLSLVSLGFVPATRSVNTGSGLLGGGSLNVDRTLYADYSANPPLPLGVASDGFSSQLSRGDHVHPALDFSDLPQTQGVLPLARGGTGAALSPSAGAVAYSTTSALALSATGQIGTFLVSGGTGGPTWVSFPSANPAALGTASPGVSNGPARSDHVHPAVNLNDATTVGLLPVPKGGTGVTALTGYVKGAGATPLTASPMIPAADINGILPPLHGGTGITNYIPGDLIVATGSSTLASLSDVAEGNALISGGVGELPAWDKISLSDHITGVLPPANGGTGGSVTQVAGAITYSNGTSFALSGVGVAGQFLTSGGAGAPTWTGFSLANPAPLGVPSPGTSPQPARADHVHQSVVIGGGITGTMADFNAACTDGDFVYQAHAATLTTLDVRQAGAGGLSLNTGGGANAGYVSFYNVNAVARVGYIGFQVLSAGGNITYVNENGGGHQFLGVVYTTNLFLDDATGTTRATWYRTSGGNRWVMGASSGPESGSNNGSDFFINRYADNGAFLSTPFQINRVDGQTYFGSNVNFLSDTVWINGAGAGLLLQKITGGDSYIRSYSGNLYLGYTNNNSVVINSAGLTLNSGQFIGTDGSGNQMLLKSGVTNTPTAIFRNDGSTFYILLSDPSIYPQGGWNALRPFAINANNGVVSMAQGLVVTGGNVSANNCSVIANNGTVVAQGNGGVALLRGNGDIVSHRNNNSGVVYLGNAQDHYLFFDGGAYYLAGNGNLYMTNDIHCNATITAYVNSSGNIDASGNINSSGNIAGNGVYGNYIQSGGEIRSVNGIFNCTGAGLSAGYRAVNNNVGHDYRLVAKDAGPFAITNESLGIEYINFDTGGNISVSRDFHLNAQTYCVDIIASGWHRNTGTTGLYNNTYGRGWTVPDGTSSYGQMSVYGTGLNGWNGICLSANNKTHLMSDGANTVGLYDATVPRWLWQTDYAGNFTAAGNVAAFSDLRLKQNVRPIDDPIRRRDALAVAAIKYERDGRTRIGYGAQTLREYGCGEFVVEAENDAMKLATGLGTLSVDYGETAAVLAVASKLTDDRVTQLEARIAELEAIIRKLT